MCRSDDDLLNVRLGDSKLWHFICQQSDIVDMGSRWQIRKGQSVNFFNDTWLFEKQSIKEVCLRPLSAEEEESTVSEWVVNGTWDFTRLSNLVPNEVMQRLISKLPPMTAAGDDILAWNATTNGDFTVKSAYYLIEQSQPNSYSSTYNAIWKWTGFERIRVSLWIAFNNRLPTNAWRSKWAGTSPICSHCGIGSEDTIHILHDCSYA
ncbi:uncharacterized protein LOC114742086 [Neltuma alba]|uniref:uncharacterized protein LOC114742086 n=1 Tax=Neltuma alba TaxID=207710 RepID=UPI0010A3742E|nr:uncharacterized protein LOC114742086 [Prosopis alba]